MRGDHLLPEPSKVPRVTPSLGTLVSSHHVQPRLLGAVGAHVCSRMATLSPLPWRDEPGPHPVCATWRLGVQEKAGGNETKTSHERRGLAFMVI